MLVCRTRTPQKNKVAWAMFEKHSNTTNAYVFHSAFKNVFATIHAYIDINIE